MSGPAKFWGFLFVGVAALMWGLRSMGSGEVTVPSRAESSVSEAAGSGKGEGSSSKSYAAGSNDRAPVVERVSAEAESGQPLESEGTDVETSRLTTVQQVASEIGGRSPALVVFFSTECPRSRGLFPSLVDLANELSDDTTVMAYSTLEQDARRLPDFLSMYGASFGATPMQQWAPGEMTEAMQEVGIRVGPQFALPLVAVVGEGGAVLGQWQGVTDLAAVRQALRSGGMLR